MKAKPKLLKFKSLGKSSTNDKIIDQGELGELSYEVYERGVIHIFDDLDETHRFKKDRDIFEDEILNTDFSTLSSVKEIIIKGSGDNDDLIFQLNDNNEIKLSLRKKGFEMIDKLKSILSKKPPSK